MEDVRQAVREQYGKIAAGPNAGAGCCVSGACSGDAAPSGACASETSRRLGYSDEEMSSVPEGADLGLGCGNPQAIAGLRLGETVLDLGSGGGFDCFLAARRVGETGAVIGVDMTAEMIERARLNAKTAGTRNVEFRLGEIEHLPVADASVDAIMSNCVINLSPDKPAVYREAFRVLKRGGRVAFTVWDLPEHAVAFGALYGAVRAHGSMDMGLPHGPNFF
ncbi:arsenite methyltransferase, partial [bacterium]|nr:arsenite methyltransferase [bacterium]